MLEGGPERPFYPAVSQTDWDPIQQPMAVVPRDSIGSQTELQPGTEMVFNNHRTEIKPDRALACVDDFRSNDQQGITDAYDRFCPIVMSFLRKHECPQGVSEEVFQETMLRVWEKIDTFDIEKSNANKKDKFSTWVLTIAYNLLIDYQRNERRRPQKADLDYNDIDIILNRQESSDLSPEEQVLATETAIEVRSALEKLPDGQKQAITLAYYNGLTEREIAELTGIPLGTIKARKWHGLKNMKARLQYMVEPEQLSKNVDRTGNIGS
ncbi:MAG: sigma-70 family RNA polymerase sigma factor [Candidatus Levybacteria bacterium]|nr:sigma-70 family RNA polymerase sigma factor [Candidatus Levybacteria bacterium]